MNIEINLNEEEKFNLEKFRLKLIGCAEPMVEEMDKKKSMDYFLTMPDEEVIKLLITVSLTGGLDDLLKDVQIN